MYTIHKLTGSRLVGSDGHDTGPESAGVVSMHPSRWHADRALAELNRLGGGINRGRYQIRDADGDPVQREPPP